MLILTHLSLADVEFGKLAQGDWALKNVENKLKFTGD